jgi:hypothetical protein
VSERWDEMKDLDERNEQDKQNERGGKGPDGPEGLDEAKGVDDPQDRTERDDSRIRLVPVVIFFLFHDGEIHD